MNVDSTSTSTNSSVYYKKKLKKVALEIIALVLAL